MPKVGIISKETLSKEAAMFIESARLFLPALINKRLRTEFCPGKKITIDITGVDEILALEIARLYRQKGWNTDIETANDGRLKFVIY